MMFPKLAFLWCLAFLVVNVNSVSLKKVVDGSISASKKDLIKQALKEFVELVDLYNLNVTVVGSHRLYVPNGDVKEELGISVGMPVNDEFLTEPTLDDNKQAKYLKQFKKFADPLGIKTRVILIEKGETKEANVQSVGESRLIESENYKWLTHYHNGKQGFVPPKNNLSAVVHNFLITDKEDHVGNIKVYQATVVISEAEVTENFPKQVLEEAKKIIPKLFYSIEDDTILARLIVQHLDKNFETSHQVQIGVDQFSYSGNNYAHLRVGNTNVVIFIF